jgi:Na+/melibiose symporter-like transporter
VQLGLPDDGKLSAVFYTDGFGLAAVVAGTLLLTAPVWDGVFDGFMEVI